MPGNYWVNGSQSAGWNDSRIRQKLSEAHRSRVTVRVMLRVCAYVKLVIAHYDRERGVPATLGGWSGQQYAPRQDGRPGAGHIVQNRPMTLPSASMSMLAPPGEEPRPGMVRISPHNG